MAEMVFRVSPDSLGEAGFMSEFGGIYEHSPWVADGLWQQGIGPDDASVPHFAARMAAIVDAAGKDRQLALLRAHPELAGKLGMRAKKRQLAVLAGGIDDGGHACGEMRHGRIIRADPLLPEPVRHPWRMFVDTAEFRHESGFPEAVGRDPEHHFCH